MRTLPVFIVTISLVLAGCETMTKEQIGTGTGAVLGAIVGNKVARDGNRAAGTVIGAVVGGIIGNKIGAYLQNPTDKRRAEEATIRAAETGQAQQFQTTSGATVTASSSPVSAPPVVNTGARPVAAASEECRSVNQTIVLANGSQEQEAITMCKGAEGWYRRA
jgi:surface antigen